MARRRAHPDPRPVPLSGERPIRAPAQPGDSRTGLAGGRPEAFEDSPQAQKDFPLHHLDHRPRRRHHLAACETVSEAGAQSGDPRRPFSRRPDRPGRVHEKLRRVSRPGRRWNGHGAPADSPDLPSATPRRFRLPPRCPARRPATPLAVRRHARPPPHEPRANRFHHPVHPGGPEGQRRLLSGPPQTPSGGNHPLGHAVESVLGEEDCVLHPEPAEADLVVRCLHVHTIPASRGLPSFSVRIGGSCGSTPGTRRAALATGEGEAALSKAAREYGGDGSGRDRPVHSG